MTEKGAARFAWGVLWAISVGLRLALAWVNREANDRHVEDVIVPLLKAEPSESFLWYYHPKLYHYVVVGLIRLFHLNGLEGQIVCAQLVNAAAGIATLTLLFFFLRSLTLRWPIQVLVFGFFGLNPGLVGISAQATNDAFVIFFVVAGTLAATAYFRTQGMESPSQKKVTANFLYLLLLLLCLGLALATKGNGIGLAVAVGGLMLVNFVVSLARKKLNSTRHLLEFSLLAFFSAAALISLKVYTIHLAYFRFLSSDRMVIGRFWGVPKGIPVASARGLALLKSSLFSLPFGDLIRHPFNQTPDSSGAMATALYPFTHMRNYWMQIYGNFAVTRFHDWPPSWRNVAPAGEWLSRGLLSFNLVPLFFLLLGLGLIVRSIRKPQLATGVLAPSASTDTTLLAVFFVFLAAGVRYFMIFPCYQFAKFIYIAPFLIPLAYAVACGMHWAWEKKRGPQIVVAVFVSLFVMNVVDLVWLIWDLMHRTV